MAGVIIAALLALLFGGRPAMAAGGAVNAVGVENEYADVISQIGGKYVDVTSIESEPNSDLHMFQISPKVASQIAGARLIVENGLGYDGWVDKVIAAAPNPGRQVINVQHLLGLPDNTPNPHLWYDPGTMPAVAKAVAAALSNAQPENAAVFYDNAAVFIASLKPWDDALAAFKRDFPETPVAATEPVANYMLAAAGTDIETPFSLQAAIMNETNTSPQDVALQNSLFTNHHVKVFLYNRQVTDALTQSFLELSKQNGIPVVGVYETMPTPGYDYQSWMLAEVVAMRKAVTTEVSTDSLIGK